PAGYNSHTDLSVPIDQASLCRRRSSIMPEYLAPGVYVEEIATGPVPIEGVSTSTAGFVGPTERGPEYARLVTSWLDYQRWYGGYIPDQSYLAYAVQGFFANGGQRCFASRIVSNSATAAQI